MLQYADVTNHIGARVRVLDEDPGMFGLQGELARLDRSPATNELLPYPVAVRLSYDSPLEKPVVIHVRSVELVTGDFELELQRGLELVEKIGNLLLNK